MNNTVKTVFIFVLGAATGSVVTWKLLKTKYEQIAQEEIDSVKAVYSKQNGDTSSDDIDDVDDDTESTFVGKSSLAHPSNVEKPAISEYISKLKEGNYISYSDMSNKKEPEEQTKEAYCEPFVIPPEEFGEIEEYELHSLKYYSDGVLADDDDERIEDVAAVVGTGSLDTFGDFEDDAVHVRNHRLKSDFEILKVKREYSEVLTTKPYLVEE